MGSGLLMLVVGVGGQLELLLVLHASCWGRISQPRTYTWSSCSGRPGEKTVELLYTQLSVTMKKSPLQLLQRCEGKFLRNICTRRKALNGDSLVDGGVVLVEDERVGDGDVYKKAENVLVHFPAL